MEELKKDFDESIVKEQEAAREEAESKDQADTAAQPEAERESADRSDEKEDKSKDKSSKKSKKKSIKALELKLEKSEARAEELTDKYQRLMAEFENARKRNAREQSHMYDVGAKEVLSKLLPVIDNFERGIDVLSEEEKEGAFAQGILKIYQQMMTALEELGVKPMDAKGKEFDPDFHNAVMHAEDEEMGENIVAEEFQKGYMYKDMVLRHSMVKVVN